MKMLIVEYSVIFPLIQLPRWVSLIPASLRVPFFPVPCSSSPLLWLITRHLPHSNNFFSLTNFATLLYQLLAQCPTPQHLLLPAILLLIIFVLQLPGLSRIPVLVSWSPCSNLHSLPAQLFLVLSDSSRRDHLDLQQNQTNPTALSLLGVCASNTRTKMLLLWLL